MSIKLTASRQQGFTLLEIVLVLFLLGLMASSTLFLTQNVEDQAKYDETKNRLKMIRTAIIGDTRRTINGRPEISGFAADMGRLPECLRELLSPVDCANSVAPLPAWGQDNDSQVWAGWRGPYLTGNSEISGQVHFRDGYGNSDTDTSLGGEDWKNSGWIFPEVLSDLIIVSTGFDGVITNDINSDDVPRPTVTQPLINPLDYQVTLGNDWQNLDVQLYSESSNGTFIAANSLRLKLSSPDEGSILNYADDDLDTSDERDISIYLSNTFPENDVFVPFLDGTIEVKNNESLSFVPDVTLSTDNVSVTIGPTTVITYTDDNGISGDFTVNSKCLPDCILTIPDSNRAINLNGNPVTNGTIDELEFSANNTVTISPHYTAPIVAKNLAKPVITGSVDSITGNTLTLPFNATITLASNNFQFSGLDIILPGSTITVSESFTRNENNIITDITGDIFTVPSNTPAAVGNILIIPAASTFIMGEKSFTIVCETGAEQGELFDGDCDDGNLNNISNPQSMSLVPRTTLPVNNTAIEWTIQ
jgi:prepilin-type N-terminal cleavage/methylation domain-containing protein